MPQDVGGSCCRRTRAGTGRSAKRVTTRSATSANRGATIGIFTDASIAAAGATHPFGASEQGVIAQLTSLGYNDNSPATLAKIQRSRFAYDRLNQLRFTIDALGSIVENAYNALGDITSTARFAARPALAELTEPAIDAAVDRDDAGNRVQRFAYDPLGQLRFSVQVLEPNTGSAGKHAISERRYDALGQLVDSRAYATTVGHLSAFDEATIAAAIVTDAVNDRRSAVAHDAGGRQAFAMRLLHFGLGDKFVVTKQVHDALGQLVQRIDYASLVNLTKFDTASVESAVVPSFSDRTTTYVRDAAGRARFEIQPDLSFRESVYDALDQVTEARQFDFTLPGNVPRTEAEMVALRGGRVVGDGITRGQVHTWDAVGRCLRTVDAAGNHERYEYDPLDRRTRWVDKNGNRSVCTYDRRSRKISETTPPMKFKLRAESLATPAVDRVLDHALEYDAFGNLVRKVEAANFANDACTTDFLVRHVGAADRHAPPRPLRHGHRYGGTRACSQPLQTRKLHHLRQRRQRGPHQQPHQPRRVPAHLPHVRQPRTGRTRGQRAQQRDAIQLHGVRRARDGDALQRADLDRASERAVLDRGRS